MFSFSVLNAQNPVDTTIQYGHPDTTNIYNKIQKAAKKRKITYWIYKAVFSETRFNKPNTLSQSPIVEPATSTSPNTQTQIIRSIEILSLDPFGASVYDSQYDVSNPVKRIANTMHNKTKNFIIRPKLQFKVGDTLDLFKIRDTERILRQQEAIRDCKIELVSIPTSPDSVDIVVITQDIWSIAIQANLTTSRTRINLTERNVLGLTHKFSNSVNYNFRENSELAYSGNYLIPNISGSFVSAAGYYSIDSISTTKGFNVNREFYSPLTLWAGGYNGNIHNSSVRYYDVDSLFVEKFNTEIYNQDGWVGLSFRFNRGETDQARSRRIVWTGRIIDIYHNERPPLEFDTTLTYGNSRFYLTSLGVSSRSYFKDRNIYRIDVTEDVPQGSVHALTFGWQETEKDNRIYLGFEVAAASHIDKVGYLARKFILGSFFNKGFAENGVLKTELSFFTNSITMKAWEFRQFARYRYTHGFSRKDEALLNINKDNGLFGMVNDKLSGTAKMVLNLESIFYSPYNVAGFQFAPIIFMGFGMVGSKDDPLIGNKVYQSYGLGVLILNKHLVMKSFDLTFAIYPQIPKDNFFDYKFNPLTNYSFQFRDYFLSRPGTVSFD